MPHLWNKADNNEWQPELLAGPVALGGQSSPVLVIPGAVGLVLLARGGVYVNGEPLVLGIRRLVDRDEIVIGAERVFFSTEKKADVVPFKGIDGGVCFCARCSTEITVGTPAVLCPGCGTWTHQSDELPCFRYPKAATCPRCDQSNAADAEFRFHPADL